MIALWRRLDKPGRRELVYALLLCVVAGVSGTALLGLSGWFLTTSALAGAAGAGFAFNHLYPSAGVRAAAFARVLSRYGEQVIGHDAVLQISARLRPALFEAGARSGRGLSPIDSGELSSLIDNVEAAEGGFLRIVAPTVTTAAAALTSLFFAFAADVRIGLFALAGFVVTGIWLPQRTAARAHLAAQQLAETTERTRAQVARLIENTVELDVVGALARSCEQTALQLREYEKRRSHLEQPFRDLGLAVAVIGAGAALACIVRADVSHVALSAGAALALVAAFDATAAMAKVFHAAPRAEAAARRLEARLTRPPCPPTPEQPAKLATVLPLRAQGLMIAPSETAAPILVPDFTMESGQIVEVIGVSGSGKTTLAETLMRLQPLRGGALRYGEEAFGAVTTPAVLAHIAISPQLPTFMPGALRNQFLLAQPNASDDTIFAALKWACVETVVTARAAGLSTRIGDDNSGFSGGELRRIGLARALLANPQILILDEPFVGLDASLATRLSENLARWAGQGDRALMLLVHAETQQAWRGLQRSNLRLGAA